MRFFLALVVMLVSAASVVAAEKPSCSTPIKFAYYESNFFYFEKSGIDVDVVDELKKRTGCSFDTVEMPRARIWVELANGTLDMSGSGLSTPAREEFAWFGYYVTMKNYAVFFPSVVKIASAEDIVGNKAITIGVVRSFQHGATIDALVAKVTAQDAARVVEVKDQETLFKMLQANRIQVAFGQPPAYTFHFKKLGIKDAQAVDIAPGETTVDHGLILSKKRFNEVEAKKWQAVVADMRADGTMKKILEKYLSPADADRIALPR